MSPLLKAWCNFLCLFECHKPEKSHKWVFKGCRNQLTFHIVEFIWHSGCFFYFIYFLILKKDIVRFHGLISNFQVISFLGHWLNNVLLDILWLHQKSWWTAVVTLPTTSSFNNLSAFPRCKVAIEQSRWYIRAPPGCLNAALVQRVWQIHPLPYVFRAPRGLDWLVRAVYWPYEFTLRHWLSRWNTHSSSHGTGSDCYYIANPWRWGSSLWWINKGDGPYSTSAQLLTFRGGEIVTSI